MSLVARLLEHAFPIQIVPSWNVYCENINIAYTISRLPFIDRLACSEAPFICKNVKTFDRMMFTNCASPFMYHSNAIRSHLQVTGDSLRSQRAHKLKFTLR